MLRGLSGIYVDRLGGRGGQVVHGRIRSLLHEITAQNVWRRRGRRGRCRQVWCSENLSGPLSKKKRRKLLRARKHTCSSVWSSLWKDLFPRHRCRKFLNTCASLACGSDRAAQAAEGEVDVSSWGLASAVPMPDVTPQTASSMRAHRVALSDTEWCLLQFQRQCS